MSSKKGKKVETTSDSDSGPDDRNPPPKKVKTDNVSQSKSKSEDSLFQLSKMRFVSVREFRGKVMVDIREYYESDGDLKPGKKGICLNLDQWKALKSHIDNIDEAIKQF
ncbi:activated RNA polymerase II transcriptional coactivator p15-like isoform X1 [Tachypleus tridentatus]|uniref:activated RNA polymerase II transcriptional coactivator p15-like isoform X1 n=1 Tax=Tachypleus tridentatus TaxID=6853 RepID=UPI003FCFDF87